MFAPFFTEFDPRHHSSGDFGFGKRGLGLGLYLVKSFIEMHGGHVAAVSTPGEGTEVTIHLPRRPRPFDAGCVQSRPDAPSTDPDGEGPADDPTGS
jgi:K+-sensing histidine kinase KdpD